MKVKKAGPEHISIIVDFQLKMAHETESITLDQSLLTKGVGQVFSDPTKGFYIIVEDDGKQIASVLLTPEWSDWRNSTFLWIQSLYVLPTYRKKGIFRKIYNFVRTMVNSTDEYAGIKLYVDENNNIAQKAYTKVGMDESHYRLFEWYKMKF